MNAEISGTSYELKGQPVAIVSGYGNLPYEIARGAIAAGSLPFMIGIEGEAEPSIEEFDHRYMNLGQLGALFKLLKAKNIHHIVMAGGVHQRPEVFQLKLDWGAISSIPRILAVSLGGDSNLLTGLVKLFEDHDIQVLGAHQVAPKLLASSGVIANRKPNKKDMHNINLAAIACKMLGKLDIGQAAIAEAKRVIAVEGVEGTDGLLKRIVDLRTTGRMPEKGKNGVLVKLVKPGQDHRVDLPTIGPQTILGVKEAGLNGIVVGAGNSLILERVKTLELATKHKVYIYGLDSSTIVETDSE